MHTTPHESGEDHFKINQPDNIINIIIIVFVIGYIESMGRLLTHAARDAFEVG